MYVCCLRWDDTHEAIKFLEFDSHTFFFFLLPPYVLCLFLSLFCSQNHSRVSLLTQRQGIYREFGNDRSICSRGSCMHIIVAVDLNSFVGYGDEYNDHRRLSHTVKRGRTHVRILYATARLSHICVTNCGRRSRCRKCIMRIHNIKMRFRCWQSFKRSASTRCCTSLYSANRYSMVIRLYSNV